MEPEYCSIKVDSDDHVEKKFVFKTEGISFFAYGHEDGPKIEIRGGPRVMTFELETVMECTNLALHGYGSMKEKISCMVTDDIHTFAFGSLEQWDLFHVTMNYTDILKFGENLEKCKSLKPPSCQSKSTVYFSIFLLFLLASVLLVIFSFYEYVYA